MAILFIVADTDPRNFPKSADDLRNRLSEVKKGVPKQRNNIKPFVKPAFTLLKDCGLITKTLVDNLCDEIWCRNTFDCEMNPLHGGGVLRERGLTMWTASGLRYYCPCSEMIPADREIADLRGWKSETKLAIVCEGVTYYISNNWYNDENRHQKEIFYDWLSLTTWTALKRG